VICSNKESSLLVTAKRSVDELFMNHFHNLLSASGGEAFRPHTCSISGPAGGLLCPDPLFAHPWKKSCGRPRTSVSSDFMVLYKCCCYYDYYCYIVSNFSDIDILKHIFRREELSLINRFNAG